MFFLKDHKHLQLEMLLIHSEREKWEILPFLHFTAKIYRFVSLFIVPIITSNVQKKNMLLLSLQYLKC